MADDEALRQRIIDAAAELFAQHGYEGTRVRMVAQHAGLSPHTVRKLTGGRSELFAAVMAAKVRSDAADRVEQAAEHPELGPPLAVLIDAASQVFTAPARSWDLLELEALTRAHRDPELREVETARVAERVDNARMLISQIRRAGGLDPDVAEDALTHFVVALSVGLAAIDPVLAHRPRAEDWNALIARIASAMVPSDMLISPEHEARIPWRVRVDVPDAPGAVARLMRALGSVGLYTVAMQVVGAGDGARTIDIALTAPEGVSESAVLAAALSAGRNGYITEGSPEDAEDLPTRMIDGATRLISDPAWGPRAAAELLEADSVEVIDPNEGSDDSARVLRLQWTADDHVVLHRSWAPFARAEQARASALLRFAAAIAQAAGDEDAVGWMEPIKDGRVWIRLAHPEDADALADMHQRCSERTRYLRYVTFGEWRDVQLRRLAGGHRGATLVAMSESGSIVAVANVFPDSEQPDRAAEIALLVEDAYQSRGVGSALLHRQIALARRLGFREVVAVVLAENAAMLGLLRRTPLEWRSTVQAGVATWRAPLPDPDPHPGNGPA